MPLVIAIGGIFIPSLLVLAILLLPIFWLLDLALGRMKLYRHAWHPSLNRIALFTLIYSLIALFVFG